MPSTRTIRNLTEGWPESPANFELQAFAAALADDRPVLSPPAFDRIEVQIAQELDSRQALAEIEPPRPTRIARGMGRRVAPAVRVLAPYAAAACLLVAAGVWLNDRWVTPRIVPSQPDGALITDQPPEWQAPTPEDQAQVPKPAPTGG